MVKLTKRKGFNFFRSYYDVYNELSDKDKVAFMDALLDRQFQGIKPENLTGLSKFAYISQTNSIDSQVKGYEDKTGNIHTPTEGGAGGGSLGGADTPTLQVEEKEKGKVELLERKKVFRQSIKDFIKDNPDKYPKQLYIDFEEYWTEHGDKDKKMRYEKEKTFGLSRRLSSWSKNGFNDYTTKSNPSINSQPVN